MKTLILILCLYGAFTIQGCAVYAEPVGDYYVRGGVWYYHDGGGREWRENRKYHHVEEHHDDHH